MAPEVASSGDIIRWYLRWHYQVASSGGIIRWHLRWHHQVASDDAVRVLEVNRALHFNEQQLEVASGNAVMRQGVKSLMAGAYCK